MYFVNITRIFEVIGEGYVKCIGYLNLIVNILYTVECLCYYCRLFRRCLFDISI